MFEYQDINKMQGTIKAIIEYKNGTKEERIYKNTILNTGKQAQASTLANQIGSSFQFYITNMLFGNNGTQGGVPLFVDASRNGLFGLTIVSKPVIATIDPNTGTSVTFTSILAYEDAVGIGLSEMALQMANSNLYAMRTFPVLTKTADMQITWQWQIEYL